MGIEVWRDWVIVIQGIILIILILVLIVLSAIIYSRINKVIKRGQQVIESGQHTIDHIERSFSSSYYKAGVWIFGWLGETISEKLKKKTKEE